MHATRLLSDAFLQAHPQDAARVLERLPVGEQAKLFDGSTAAARVMEYMAPVARAACLALMDVDAAARVITELSLDCRLAALRCMEAVDRERILQACGPNGDPLRVLLRYPAGTAGALMDPYLLTFPDDVTVGEVLRRARRSGQPVMYYLYVVDREQRLAGVATLRQLMRARSGDALSAVMRREVARLPAMTRSDDIVKNPHWRNFHALPVVDEQGRFLGVIRHEILRRVEQEVAQSSHDGGAVETLLALGELYWISLTGMMPGIGGSLERRPDAGDDPEHSDGN
jgi:magnesium transporter